MKPTEFESSASIRQLRDAEKFMTAVVDSSDDAIITKDLNGIITSWNKSAQRLFGYAAEEIIGKPVALLVPADRQDEERSILERIRRGERIDHYETVRQRKDGSLFNLSITVSPVKDDQGHIIGASKVGRDITHRKEIELELNKAWKMLADANSDLEKRVADRTASLERVIAQMEEFSYSVSHDLRSPIRTMKGYAVTALEDHGKELTEPVREYLNRIVLAGSRMEQLIHDVLTYSRLARSETNLKPVAMDKLIPDIVLQYDSLQPPHAEIIIRKPMQPVFAHEPSLAQAVSNLLINSVKFVKLDTHPQIQVWTEANNGHVRLWIQDNGIGIKPEYQHRLFKMFERVHQNQEYEGTGIGLAIVRKAVEKMGGQVGVESDGVNGSSFWIELPAAPPPE